MKNLQEELNNIFELAEERISENGDKSINIQSEEQENTKKNRNSDLWVLSAVPTYS